MNAGKYGLTSHFWVELIDKELKIIDATITQFDFAKKYSDIYIAQVPTEINVNSVNSNWFEPTFKGWIRTFAFPDRYNLAELQVDLRAWYMVSIKAAVLINNEIDLRGIKANEVDFLITYFSGIFDILRIAPEETFRSFSYIKGFDKLLDKQGYFPTQSFLKEPY